MTDIPREQIEALIEKWRDNAEALRTLVGNNRYVDGAHAVCEEIARYSLARQHCADDLAALLRALPQTVEQKGGDVSEQLSGRTSAGSIGADGGVTHPPTNTSPVLSSPSAATQEQERCICAAVLLDNGKIIRGQRHGDCLRQLASTRVPPERQGFVTSRNRFVTREEGYQLQIAAGIESVAEGGYRGERLFSEDLY